MQLRPSPVCSAHSITQQVRPLKVSVCGTGDELVPLRFCPEILLVVKGESGQVSDMKKLLVLALATVGMFAGCKSVDSALFKPVSWTTQEVASATVLVKTQRVDIVLTTNVIGQTLTNTAIVWTTNTVVIPAHTVATASAWEVNPATASTVSALGAATGPWGALGAMAVTAILGGIAAFRGKKYKDAAISLAQGVQQVAEAYPANAKAIIETQRQVQDADGTRDTVKTILKQVVKKPVPATV